MSKSAKSQSQKKESRKETIAKIAAENRAYFERMERKEEKAQLSITRTSSQATTQGDSVAYICPHCHSQCGVPSELVGSDVNCPNCSNVFNATSQQKDAPTSISKASEKNTNRTNLTPAQFAVLENSIRTTLNTVIVQNIRLAHLGGSKYKAHLTIMTAQGSEQCVADVNFDGENFAWQIANEAPKGTAGFRLLGLVILLFCGWMMFLTYDEYHNGALITATAKYLSVLHTTDLPSSPEIAQVQQKMDVLQWKGFFIGQIWWAGCFVGFVQLCTGRHFANLPWLKIFIAWGIGFVVALIQRL